MTERQAWLYLAQCVARATDHHGTWLYPIGDGGLLRGLCGGVDFLHLKGEVTNETHRRMAKKVAQACLEADIEIFPWAWARNRAGYRQRVKFCRKMARQCSRKDGGA